jgi:hypothetical protein
MDKALEEGKPVVLLHLESLQPYFAEGIQNERLQILSYTEETIKEVLEYALEIAKEKMDIRFNFFIPPKIGVYLDWVAKNRKLPRAVFIRKLIEEHMKRDKEYKG